MNLSDLFTTSSLSAAVVRLPYAPGKIGAMGLFAEQGVATTYITIDEQYGRLVLIGNTSRNDEGKTLSGGKRNRRTFEACHLPLTTVINPNDLQNIAPFGQDRVENAQARIVNDKLQSLKNSIEVTREWHRIGAISGKILDADGSVIYDLFAEFGVQKKSSNIAFSNAQTDVRKFCLDAKRHAEKKLSGVMVTGYRAMCDAQFFDALTSHPSVQKAYANYQEAQDRIGGDMRSGFRFGDIEFIEYEAEVSGKKFIPDGTAKVFPVGSGVFAMFNAPANYNETVNTVGQPYYAKAEQRKMGKGWDIEVQANPLAMCLFPEALVEMKAT